MEEEIKDTGNPVCRELLDVFQAQGVESAVISPGSRNTPLIIGLAAREEIRKLVISDERTAGFMALGISMISGKPTMLACTSGTALYNYAPAVAEAYYQRIPLIVVSADRPIQWIDQDDSQTLRQRGALSNIVKKDFDIQEETGMNSKCLSHNFADEREWYANRIANEAYNLAERSPKGPVHINIGLANPLNRLTEYREREPRVIKCLRNESGLSDTQARGLASLLADKRILVVAGFMYPSHKLNRAVKNFCSLGNVSIMCETISNLHLEREDYMVDSVLCRLTEREKGELAPDIIISIGGSLISRHLKEYLRGCDSAEHWTLGDTDISSDCFQNLTTHIETEPVQFFNLLAAKIRKAVRKGNPLSYPDYSERWKEAKKRAAERNSEYLASAPWSELKALEHIFGNIPERYNLFLSNGTCVRYAQILAQGMPHACYCNRGVSGIDGTNATALGAARAYAGTTLLVTGDTSFSYCPEILGLADDEADLRIIVINNAGGGIFRFVNTTRDLDIRERYFCNPKEMPLAGLAEAYGWDYQKATDPESLKRGMEHLKRHRRCILEVFADPEISADTLKNYFEYNI